MAILIDTNIAIHLRDGDPEIRERARHFPRAPSISIVTRIELEAGVVAEQKFSTKRRLLTDELLAELPVLDFGGRMADAYRNILQICGYSRSRVLDRMIAATAIVHDLTLITINGADFRDIPGLKLEIWPSPAAQ